MSWFPNLHEPGQYHVGDPNAALVEAINAHAKALLEVAAAIREHTALQAQDTYDEETIPGTYLDGTRIG